MTVETPAPGAAAVGASDLLKDAGPPSAAMRSQAFERVGEMQRDAAFQERLIRDDAAATPEWRWTSA